MPSSPAPPRLAAREVTKSYGGVVVLDHVDIEVEAGEVRAVLGENGAGKTTLIKVLAGVVEPDDATVELDGVPAAITSPRVAMRLGIATLHQELAIVPGLSVAENVFLGHPMPTRLGAVRWRVLERRASDLFDRLGHAIDVRRDVESLSPVGRTMTALARALSYDSRVLVLDEPTAALTDAETALLFAAMRRLAEHGVAVLYVSHRLEEVLAVCDTYTVLRNGRRTADGAIAEATVQGLVAAMAGRPIDAIFPDRRSVPGDVVLSTRDLAGQTVHGTDLDVRRGEVLGIAGLAGSGRSELLRLLAGAQSRTAGTVTLDGRPVDGASVSSTQRRGIVLVPQERRADGLIPMSVEHNTNLTTVARHAVGRMVMSPRRSRRHATTQARRLDVRYRSISQDIFTLSGGNQQKVVLAKFLALDPAVLLLDEPTRGVDVATKSQIYHLVEDRAAAGGAVVVVSSELPELLGLAHRVVVVHQGRIVGEFDPRTSTEHELLLACYGKRRSVA